MTRIIDRLFQLLQFNSQQRLSHFLADSEGWIQDSGKHITGGLYNIVPKDYIMPSLFQLAATNYIASRN